jgi:hypothetical protein
MTASSGDISPWGTVDALHFLSIILSIPPLPSSNSSPSKGEAASTTDQEIRYNDK